MTKVQENHNIFGRKQWCVHKGMIVTEDEKQEQTASSWIWTRMQWQAFQTAGSAPSLALGMSRISQLYCLPQHSDPRLHINAVPPKEKINKTQCGNPPSVTCRFHHWKWGSKMMSADTTDISGHISWSASGHSRIHLKLYNSITEFFEWTLISPIMHWDHFQLHSKEWCLGTEWWEWPGQCASLVVPGIQYTPRCVYLELKHWIECFLL